MSKFKIKANCEGVVKAVEFDRSAQITLNQVKSLFEAQFKANITAIRYQSPDGKLTPLYQDFHLAEAMKDAERNKARFIQLDIDKYAPPSAYRPPASVSSPPSFQTQSQSQPQPQPQSQSQSQTRSKFCEECGAPRAPNAKFCTECGFKWGATPASPSQGSTSVASLGGEVCPACGQGFGSGGTLVKAMDKVWHKNCFVCNGCRATLEGGFIPGKNGLPLCEACYRRQV